jgi:hypothetical protein
MLCGVPIFRAQAQLEDRLRATLFFHDRCHARSLWSSLIALLSSSTPSRPELPTIPRGRAPGICEQNSRAG